MSNKTFPKTSGVEFITEQLLNYAVNPEPIEASIRLFFDSLNIIQKNNIMNVLNELKEQVNLIEKKTGRSLYFDRIVFEEDILSTLQRAKEGLNGQKRKLYVTFMAACIHPENLDCNNKAIFSNYLDKLDYLSVYILNSLDSYHTEKKLVDKIGCKYDENVILVHLWDLKANNLVDTISAEEFEKSHRRYGNIKLRHPENVFLYKRNKLGGEFLNFIIKGMPDK